MPLALSDMERKILDYMVHYLRENTYQPSIREIGERFGIKSTKTVSEHLQSLATKGYLERDPSRSRGVRILGVDLHSQAVSVPCYDGMPDGAGRLKKERAETHLTLDRRLAGEKGAFFVRARGDEPPVLGVTAGDYLLVEPAVPADVEDGALVVAERDSQAAYFRFSRNGRGAVLQPLGADGEPTRVEDVQSLNLIGRVTAVYRRLDAGGASAHLTAH